MQSVYAIGYPGSSYVKIGRSVDPAGRLRGIQTGNPLPLEILAETEPTVDAPEIEKYVPRVLADLGGAQAVGEWMRLSDDLVALLVEALNCPTSEHGEALRWACSEAERRKRAGQRAADLRPTDKRKKRVSARHVWELREHISICTSDLCQCREILHLALVRP